MSDDQALFALLIRCFTIFNICFDAPTILIIIKFTPKNMNSMAYYLLLILGWNLLVNALFCFGHPYPVDSVDCFSLGGPLSGLGQSELIGHIWLGTILFAAANCAAGIFMTYHYRYMAIKRIKTNEEPDQKSVIIYFVCLHLAISGLFIWTYWMSILSVDSYPFPDDSILRNDLFCYVPYGSKMLFLSVFLVTVFGLTSVCLSIFVALSLYELNKNAHIISEQTARIQRKYIWNLIIFSVFPLVSGGIPLMLLSISFMLPDTESHYMRIVCMIVLLDYGPFLCVFCFVRLRPYRSVLKRGFRKVKVIVGKSVVESSTHVE
ncbi:hypothetical protein L596_026947 [Steinernema carpocapsae]|uniref:G-protein coupled receptors family 1 profile domain-containing protein n=1 Tax=Steinernema carpocapsae TaxID=34508 RepID=A0A4U5M2V0_STECR|nr:hypothetical protein L596_026947 [Steinernema carpocapsae]